jgi:PBSX family phage terminase large subunit
MNEALEKVWAIKHGGTGPQLNFWKATQRFRAFVGGVGSGKTRAGVVEVLRQPSNSRGTVVAPTYRMLQDATIHTFLEVTEEAGVLQDYKKSDQMAYLHNGTEILFRSCDDPDKLRGPNLGWFWLDEAAMMPQMVWDLMIGRLRLLPGLGWVTTTPRGMNWLYKLFVKEGREDYNLVQCSSKTNTFLPDYFIKALEDKYTGYWLKQELEGAFVESTTSRTSRSAWAATSTTG